MCWLDEKVSTLSISPQSGYRGRGSRSRRDASITQSPYDLCRFGGTLGNLGLGGAESEPHDLTCRFKTSQNPIIYASCGIIIIIIAGRMEIDGNGKNHQAASLWISLLLPIPLLFSLSRDLHVISQNSGHQTGLTSFSNEFCWQEHSMFGFIWFHRMR